MHDIQVTELAIVYFLLVEVAPMLLIIYITKGKGAFARLRRYKRLFKILKQLDDAGFDFVYPKVAVNRGVYFEQAAATPQKTKQHRIS